MKTKKAKTLHVAANELHEGQRVRIEMPNRPAYTGKVVRVYVPNDHMRGVVHFTTRNKDGTDCWCVAADWQVQITGYTRKL